eukprot:2469485-Alexandrium_andersonii.AAC.1
MAPSSSKFVQAGNPAFAPTAAMDARTRAVLACSATACDAGPADASALEHAVLEAATTSVAS